ncbi:hypothetical protein J0A71_04g08260 [Encephalitozoon cuniculi]|uniref:Uncharacterized protein n=1 Tax=Encephalitozoon cuniculi TaxID=6035 RepID=M1JI71_ENCCN|nr:hypothetical protein ECU08_0540 [Encephalitozoon cuniculi]UYI26981.1 hypothetical protein J0A71_04g08260 [Encephalitozoon cuniculi]
MSKMDKLARFEKFDLFFAAIACICGILKVVEMGKEGYPTLGTVSKNGMAVLAVLVALGFLLKYADQMCRRITSHSFSEKGGFLNPCVILSVIEFFMMLICIKAMLFYPAEIPGVDDSSQMEPPISSKFGLFGAIFMPYIFAECIRLLLANKNSRRDRVILGILVLGCLAMAGLAYIEHKGKGNFISAGILGVGLSMLLSRLALVDEDEEDTLLDPSAEGGNVWMYLAMFASFTLVLILLARSHRILFNNLSFLDSLKSFTFLGRKVSQMASEDTPKGSLSQQEGEGGGGI